MKHSELELLAWLDAGQQADADYAAGQDKAASRKPFASCVGKHERDGWLAEMRAEERSTMMIRNVEQYVRDVEDLMTALQDAEGTLETAIARERLAFQRLQEVSRALKAHEAEAVMAASMEAAQKVGPLAGIAKTSKEYDFALTTLLQRERANGLAHLYADVERLTVEHVNAEIAREQAVTRFSAVRHASDLLAALLTAMSK